MSTKRRVIGISIAATEAARRHLMQPVACWERQWLPVEGSESKLKVLRWVKTDKVQQFSDEEGTVDEPLAPLPDEQEVDIVEVEGDEEAMLIDQDADAQGSTATLVIRDDSTVGIVGESAVPSGITSQVDPTDVPEVDSSKAPSPTSTLNPQLSMIPHLGPADDFEQVADENEIPIPGIGPDVDLVVQSTGEEADLDLTDVIGLTMGPGDGAGLTMEGAGDLSMEDTTDLGVDMSALGPDGIPFSGEQDMSQIEDGDGLLGGVMMDQSLDPFATGDLDDDES